MDHQHFTQLLRAAGINTVGALFDPSSWKYARDANDGDAIMASAVPGKKKDISTGSAHNRVVAATKFFKWVDEKSKKVAPHLFTKKYRKAARRIIEVLAETKKDLCDERAKEKNRRLHRKTPKTIETFELANFENWIINKAEEMNNSTNRRVDKATKYEARLTALLVPTALPNSARAGLLHELERKELVAAEEIVASKIRSDSESSDESDDDVSSVVSEDRVYYTITVEHTKASDSNFPYLSMSLAIKESTEDYIRNWRPKPATPYDDQFVYLDANGKRLTATSILRIINKFYKTWREELPEKKRPPANTWTFTNLRAAVLTRSVVGKQISSREKKPITIKRKADQPSTSAVVSPGDDDEDDNQKPKKKKKTEKRSTSSDKEDNAGVDRRVKSKKPKKKRKSGKVPVPSRDAQDMAQQHKFLIANQHYRNQLSAESHVQCVRYWGTFFKEG